MFEEIVKSRIGRLEVCKTSSGSSNLPGASNPKNQAAHTVVPASQPNKYLSINTLRHVT